MPPERTIEPCALRTQEAAEFLSMSRAEWDKRWKGEQAPQPTRGSGKVSTCRWSREELRAWQAYGCPILERWRPIWRRMLDTGSWCPTKVVLTRDGDAA